MNNNPINILYTTNIEDIKNNINYVSSNIFVVSSYTNQNLEFDDQKLDDHKTSYEMYYINDNNIVQLTYHLIPGNGLFINNNKFDIQIDDETLKYENSYINVNNNSFKTASNINRGIFSINKTSHYYNDNFKDILNNKDFIDVKNIDQLSIDNGLRYDLKQISYYYNTCVSLMDSIYQLYYKCINDISTNLVIYPGDILYYDNDTMAYTLKETNDNGEANKPVMVCVIGSNILPDKQARFIPIERSNTIFKYDKSSIYVKSLYNSIPIYNTNNISDINQQTTTIDSSHGYIAERRKQWNINIQNPLNIFENYYIYDNLSIDKFNSLVNQHVSFYVDASKIQYNNNYNIEINGLFSDLISETIQDLYKNTSKLFVISITYSNNITKYYIVNLSFKNNRLVNNCKLYSYDSLDIITNNFSEASENSPEMRIKLHDRYYENSNSYINTKIRITELKSCPNNFVELSNKSNETYIAKIKSFNEYSGIVREYVNIYNLVNQFNYLEFDKMNSSDYDIYNTYLADQISKELNKKYLYQDITNNITKNDISRLKYLYDVLQTKKFKDVAKYVNEKNKIYTYQELSSNSADSYINQSNYLNTTHIILDIDKNLCNNKNYCYLKIQIFLGKQLTIYNTLFTTYYNSKGLINKILHTVYNNKSNTQIITKSSYIKISCHQLSDFSDTGYVIGCFNILSNSKKYYDLNTAYLRINISKNIYNFSFSKLNIYPTSITGNKINNTNYENLTFNDTGTIVNNNIVTKCYNYELNYNYIKNKKINKNAIYILIDNNKIWKQYDDYYTSLVFYTSNGEKYIYKDIKFNNIYNKLSLSENIDISQIDESKQIIKFQITSLYTLFNNQKRNINIRLYNYGTIINNFIK